MKMARFHFLGVLFILLLFESTCGGLEISNTDACADNDQASPYWLRKLKSSQEKTFNPNITKDFTCLLHPVHGLNCSWSFLSLEKEAEITTTISVCDDDRTVQTVESQGAVGSRIFWPKKFPTSVILHFNISLHDQWAFYYYRNYSKSIEVPPPPQNVNATFKDNNWLITWDPPVCRKVCPTHGLEYEVQLRDQAEALILGKKVKNSLSHTVLNVDLTQSYFVRVRTRVDARHLWSDWTPPVYLNATRLVSEFSDQPYAAVIIAISLGVPMILLAALLLVCQRVSKHLFAPVPSPPQKYLHVLENTEAFVFPDLVANTDEEITLVFFSEDEKPHKI